MSWKYDQAAVVESASVTARAIERRFIGACSSGVSIGECGSI
jgi:hypothetical protein